MWQLDGCGFCLLTGRGCIPFSSARWRVAFWCCSSVLTSTYLGFSARVVPLFWRVLLDSWDPIMGVRVAIFHHRRKPLSCALGLSRRLIVHDGSTRVASPFLFPRPESQGGHLDCVSHSLSRPGALPFPSFLSPDGGWIESERPFSLELWSPSSAWGGCGSHSVPSPSCGSPGCLPLRQGMSVSGFGLSVSPYLGLVLRILVRSLYRRSFFILRSFSMPVAPAELRSTPVVAALFPQALTWDLCVPFSIGWAVSLPGRRSSS